MRKPGVLAALIICLAVPWTAFQAQRLVVFPLKQTRGPMSTEWIGTGLAVGLDEAVVLAGMVPVTVADLRSYYEEQDLISQPDFTLASQVALARNLGAGLMVTGSYSVVDDKLKVDLKALEVGENPTLKGEWHEETGLRNLLELTQRLRDDLLKAMGKGPVEGPKVAPEAFESYIRGRIATDPTLKEVYFSKAVEIQPDYYDAQCYLAIVLRKAGRITESEKILDKLVDKHYAKAYLGLVTLARIKMNQGHLMEARALLLKSLKVMENPEAHLALADWYLRQKKVDDAARELKMAEKFGTHQDQIDALQEKLKKVSAEKKPS
ncbi:MAG: hypothetical protein P8018_05385 [Acidobacteriota bacterium]|jgi:tetratricopeptide (TPR) repeat protein